MSCLPYKKDTTTTKSGCKQIRAGSSLISARWSHPPTPARFPVQLREVISPSFYMATATAVTPPKFYDGSDYNTFKPDGTSGLTFDIITDPREVVAQHILRRWLIEPGQLDIPDIGVGVKKYLNMSMRALEAEALAATMRVQALEVDGVEDVALTYSQSPIDGGGIVLRVSLTVTLSQALGGQTFNTVFELAQAKVSYIISGQAT